MNQEKLVTELIQSHYEIIIDDLIGAFPLSIAKELNSQEFIRAKKCAIVSVNKILELPLVNAKSQKEWLNLKQQIENY